MKIFICGITYNMDVIDIPNVCIIYSHRKSSHSYSFSLFFYENKFIHQQFCIRSRKELNRAVQYWCDLYLNNVVQK